MLNRLVHHRQQILQNRNQESGAAIIVAILILMVLLLVVVIVSTTGFTAATSARDLNSREIYKNAAEAALANALLTANNSTDPDALELRRGLNNAFYGTMTNDTSTRGGEIRWRWYTEQVVLPGQRIGYYIYATGYSTDQGVAGGVTLRGQFTPVNVASGTIVNGVAQYKLSPTSPYQWGLTGVNSISTQAGAKIYSSDSYYGAVASGTGTTGTIASTNNSMTLTDDTGLIQKSFSNPANVCSGGGCEFSGTTYREFNLDPSLSGALVEENCPAGPYPVWRASDNGGVLNLQTDSCVNQLIFDVNTIVPANFTINNPLKIYSDAGVIVFKGVTVNSTRSPATLQVFSQLGNLSVGDPANTFVNSDTYAGIYFVTSRINDGDLEGGSCSVFPDSTVFGALNCYNVTLQTDSIFYLDLASLSLNVDATSRNIWIQQFVEEI